jgi:plasmid stabilization system protein ParE
VNRRVLILPRAEEQLLASALWWSEHHSADQASRWLDGFESAIAGLSVDPERLQLAPENPLFPFEVRQLLYGLRARKTHRAVFEIRGEEVIVFAVRHLHQRDISPEDV